MIMRTMMMMRARRRMMMKVNIGDNVDGDYLEHEDSGKQESHHLASLVRILFIILTLANCICHQRNKYFSPNENRFVESRRS